MAVVFFKPHTIRKNLELWISPTKPPLIHLLQFHSPPIRHFPLPLLLRFRPPSLMSSSSSPPSDSSQIKTVRAVIKGRVQGVFYRDWTVENATELGLKGWVRNRRDGSVEAFFSGSSDKVDEMERRCRRGPRDAMVTALEVFPCSDEPGSGL